jgi:FtsP/CotA-like multicopper oxidase with cupredoxin domain
MTPATKYYQLTASVFDWKISEERTIKAWGLNQSVPGPVIKATKGDTVKIKVKNELPEATILHWHGIRLPSAMDGTTDVQKPIQPGEEFEYVFTVPDAGTFWYHSHHNETQQVERGMYGSLIVEDESDPLFDADRVLVIDDMKLSGDNTFKKGNLIRQWMERHDGREGNIPLMNGRADYHIQMHAGQKERWRIVNAASARYFRLSLGGKQFKIISTDGGLLEKPKSATEVLMTPGERIEIIVGPFDTGEQFNIESLPYNRMTFTKTRHRNYANVTVAKAQPSVAFIPSQLRTIESLAPQNAEPTRKIKFSVGPSLKHGIDFLVNGQTHTEDKPVNIGELQVWEISNTSMMDHPFHLHGFFFQVIEENGEAPKEVAWKDTYNLRPRSTIKIAWMPDNRPGRWMYHCHILEHHEAGMMAHFEVVDPAKGLSGTSAHHHHHKH